MPFADAVDLAKHFGRYPPAHVLLSIQVGWKGPDESTEMTDDDFRRMRGPIGG